MGFKDYPLTHPPEQWLGGENEGREEEAAEVGKPLPVEQALGRREGGMHGAGNEAGLAVSGRGRRGPQIAAKDWLLSSVSKALRGAAEWLSPEARETK